MISLKAKTPLSASLCFSSKSFIKNGGLKAVVYDFWRSLIVFLTEKKVKTKFYGHNETEGEESGRDEDVETRTRKDR